MSSNIRRYQNNIIFQLIHNHRCLLSISSKLKGGGIENELEKESDDSKKKISQIQILR